MRRLTAALLGLAALAGAPFAAAQPRPPSAYVAALADNHRPEKDKARDALRKPAEMLSFIGLKPGDKIADICGGPGYFTRMFSTTVGAKGRVYAVEPAELVKVEPEGLAGLKALAADPVYANVTVSSPPVNAMGLPEGELDVVWTSQNYHDLHDKFMGPADVPGFNRAVFKALKPGGLYLVLDHAAQPGSGLAATDTLHRIDPATVKAEVTAAGFVFDGESPALRNPSDDHAKLVFDKSIRGKTDQFVYRFRKPAR